MVTVGSFCGEGAVAPAAGRGVFAEKEEAEGYEYNENARDDERDAPGFVRRDVLLFDEAVVNSRHHKVCNATA